MTVKSDRWIRRMAEDSGLIQPFDAQLVREVEGRRIISAGASSYGYDMRLADDGFRVFSPIHGREIDPKKFDEDSLVEPPLRASEDGSKYYLMPPHSYALGVTVETFRMPRNVTGICMGKCLSRDARIVDAATGELISIADFTAGGKVSAYKDGKLASYEALPVMSQGRKPVFIVKTSLGHKIKATSNHPFLTNSGWRALSELRSGSRIAAARRLSVFGHEELPDWEAALLGLMIAGGKCDTPDTPPTFTSADEALTGALAQCLREGFDGTATATANDVYPSVNKAQRNGSAMHQRTSLWLKSYELNVSALKKFVPARVFRAPKPSVALFLRALFSVNGSVFLQGKRGWVQPALEYCSGSEQLARDVQHLLLRFGIVGKLSEEMTPKAPAFVIRVLRSADIKLFLDEIGFWHGSHQDAAAREQVLPLLDARARTARLIYDTIPSEFWSALKTEAQALHTTLYASGLHVRNNHEVTRLELEKLVAQYPHSKLSNHLDADIVWDKIVSIEAAGVEEVFDICVPQAHNFVANNLIAHNSTYARVGLIVNTTPLEAGWTGRLVIELGNLADLPLRVYVNEGIGQVIFLESDEDCDVSYKDRGGKYQGQTGLTYSRL